MIEYWVYVLLRCGDHAGSLHQIHPVHDVLVFRYPAAYATRTMMSNASGLLV
jgi:hypothetical protein